MLSVVCVQTGMLIRPMRHTRGSRTAPPLRDAAGQMAATLLSATIAARVDCGTRAEQCTCW